jgi:DnaK suppressor protein
MPTAPVTQQAHAPSAAGPFEEFRVQLERLRTHCVKERAHASLVAAGYGGDPVEWARSTMLRFTLDDISAALARIEAGTYGACTRCGGQIPRDRLVLRPFATTCVPCAGRP